LLRLRKAVPRQLDQAERQRARHGRAAASDSKAPRRARDVEAHGAFADGEDARYLPCRLAEGGPAQHLALAWEPTGAK